MAYNSIGPVQPYRLQQNLNSISLKSDQPGQVEHNQTIANDYEFAKMLQLESLTEDLDISRDDAELFLNAVKNTQDNARDFIAQAHLFASQIDRSTPSAPPASLMNSSDHTLSKPTNDWIQHSNQTQSVIPSAPPVEDIFYNV